MNRRIRQSTVARSTVSFLRRAARLGLAVGGASLLAHCAEPPEEAPPEAVVEVASLEANAPAAAPELTPCSGFNMADHFYVYVPGNTGNYSDITAAIAKMPACSFDGKSHYPHLLTINSSSENTLLVSQYLKNKNVLSKLTLQALTDSTTEGTFAWMTYGETSTYRANTLTGNSSTADFVAVMPKYDSTNASYKFLWSLTTADTKPTYYVIEYERTYPNVVYKDADKDGYGSTQALGWAKTGAVLPSFTATSNTDCVDLSKSINPGVTEVCDGSDNNCNGEIDETAPLYCTDADKDTFGDPNTCVHACANPGAGYVTNGNDCDDDDASVHPGASESCDGVDEDCDDQVDEGATCGSNCSQIFPNLDTDHAYLYCSATSPNQTYGTIVNECTKRGYHPLVLNDVSEDRAVANEVSSRFPGSSYTVVGLTDMDLNAKWTWIGDASNYVPSSSGGTNNWFSWKPNTGDQVAWVTSQWNANAQSAQLSFGSIADKTIFNTILCESW